MQNKDAMVQAFIQKNISRAPDRFKGYVQDETGKPYHRRFAYARYEKYAHDFREGSSATRFIIAAGLRGTGKTTIVAQLYTDLLSKGMDQSHMLCVSMDEAMGALGCTVFDIVDGYEQFLAMTMEGLVEQNDRVYLFIDEAHYDPNWSLALKTVYDRSRNVFIFVTGSSAISLTTNADVARRAMTDDLFPLSFPEYNLLKDDVQPPGIDGPLATALYSSSTAKEAYDKVIGIYQTALNYISRTKPMRLNEYLKFGSLPFAIPLQGERDVYDRISPMLEKVVYQDLGATGKFDQETPRKIMNLLTLLAINDRTNLNKLASDLGMSKPTLRECIGALEKAGLIIKVWPHGSSSAHIRKTPKYKFTAPAVKAAILWKIGGLTNTNEMYGALLEDAVAMYLHRAVVADRLRGFEFDPDDNGADFIITTKDGSNIVMEIGYGHKDTEQVRNSMARCGAKYGIVVSDDALGLKEGNILVVPKELFLLS